MKNRRGVTRALMAAVYPILNVSTLTTVAMGGVHHGQAPQGTAYPYVVLEAPTGCPGVQSMGNPGEEIRFQLRIVSNAPDYAEALAIMELVKQLLDGERPTIANHNVMRLWWEDGPTYQDPEMVNDVPVWNSTAIFKALVDQVS